MLCSWARTFHAFFCFNRVNPSTFIFPTLDGFDNGLTTFIFLLKAAISWVIIPLNRFSIIAVYPLDIGHSHIAMEHCPFTDDLPSNLINCLYLHIFANCYFPVRKPLNDHAEGMIFGAPSDRRCRLDYGDGIGQQSADSNRHWTLQGWGGGDGVCQS